MLYRRFGKTGLMLPIISFGAMRSMHSWVDCNISAIPHASQQNLDELLQTALQNGIYHFETARGYGSSEKQLGEALKHFPRKDFILQTKVAPQADPRLFIRHVLDSMARLQVNYLDLLALHGINDHRSLWYSCRDGGCLAAARKLQQQGKIGHIGFSGHGPCDILIDALQHEQNGGFDYINLHWYFIFDVNRPALELAHQRDIGVYIISPNDKGGMLYAAPQSFKDLCHPFSPMMFNDIYCLQQSQVCSISLGAATVSDFDEHLNVMPQLADPTVHLTRQILALEEKMLATTGARRPDALWNDLPSWDETPGNINLRVSLWLYNLARGWDLLNYARSRYALLSTGTTWVPGNTCAHINEYDFGDVAKKFPAISEELLDTCAQIHALLAKTTQ